jgi:hypothetical protein
MKNVVINFHQNNGKIKPMHAVNNGPVGSGVRGKTGNFSAYQDAKIPFARLHDSAHYSGYGGEWSVDVHRIFCDFNADENDPNSYDFAPTDKYLKNIQDAGTKVYYRLGASIEHGKKYGTYPPKDYEKWARICEHIILHYNEGWADGFRMGIEYWEIWNEPDCVNADGSNPCWQGTREDFLAFYEIAAKYLKRKFPKLKIGGPAICWLGSGMAEEFLKYGQQHNVPLDFFSFHGYTNDPKWFTKLCYEGKELIHKYGYDNAELHLNEWNYIRGWLDEEWKYSLRSEKGLKGSSFVAAVMCEGQASPLDMLMYYDARPCGMNGIFHTDTFEPLKTYYVIKAFSKLYELGSSVEVFVEENAYACAATSEAEAAILITHYHDNDDTREELFKVEMDGFTGESGVRAEIFIVDEKNDLTLIKEEYFSGEKYSLFLKEKLFTTYFIKLYKLA